MNRLIAALALGSAAAFAPAARAPASVVAFGGAGKYEGQIFGFPEKKDLWENWDPNSPRSETNFNPFERNAGPPQLGCWLLFRPFIFPFLTHRDRQRTKL